MSELFFETQSSSFGCTKPATGGLGMGSRRVSSPYLDFATYQLPRSFSEVIDWSEYVAILNDDLFRGISKLYGYFATDIRFFATESSVKPFDVPSIRKWEILLEKDLNFQLHEHELGLNVAIYGNDFITVTLQPQRMISCPACGWSVSVRKVGEYKEAGIDFGFQNMKFLARCQGRCKDNRSNNRRQFRVQDHYVRSAKSVIIKHWPIRELDFDFLEASGQLRIYWRIPQRIKDAVLKHNDPDTLHDLDMSVLEAVCQDKMLRFDDRAMFHAKEPVLSGLRNKGLGIPRTLSLGRQHWLVQLLKKQCQALASSYIVPMEFFSMGTPGGGAGQFGDPTSMNMLDEYAAYIGNMLAAHQRDPRQKYFVPFPVTHQIAGANANQYVPVALMQYAASELSNSLIPDAMLRGDMTMAAAPVFLRMFESTNRAIPAMYNRFLWFVMDRISELLQKEAIWAKHERISVADNMAIDQILQAGAAAGKNSDYSWMTRVGLDGTTENAIMLHEQTQALEFQDEMAKIQEEKGVAQQVSQIATDGSAQAASGGQGDPNAQGGDPNAQQMMPGASMLLPSQGFRPSNDIATMSQQAADMASLLGNFPQVQRNQELEMLRSKYDAFHKLVLAELDRLRRNMANQARMQLAPNL